MSQKNNAKFAFWYLLSLVALIFMALGSGQVIFQIINKTIADFTTGYAYSYDSGVLKFAISALIICIPLYFLLARQIERSLESGDLDKDSAVRRWLTYVILFASSVVMIVWLIFTINSFLGGELTSKFLLKTVTALVIAGMVFAYYLYDIRRDSIKKKDGVILGFLIASLVITIGSLIGAFFIVESPVEARNRRHDLEVLNHFSQIDSTLSSFYAQDNKLPDNLDALKGQTPYLPLTSLKDPETGKAYEYKKINDSTYQLCADFKSDNTDPKNSQTYEYSDRWPHASGYQCLTQKAVAYNDGLNKVIPVPAQ